MLERFVARGFAPVLMAALASACGAEGDPAHGDAIACIAPEADVFDEVGNHPENPCDDGNPCTTDRCVPGACGLSRCVHDTVAGCAGCADDVGCTRNPCELGRCELGACTWTDVPYCDHLCGLIDFPGGTPEPDWFTHDVVFGSAGALSREDAPCPSSESCTCDTDLGLRVPQGNALPLAPGAAASSSGCHVDACGVSATITCTPLVSGADYVVYGSGSSDPGGDLPIDGFCLATDAHNLYGSFDGVVALDAGLLRFSAQPASFGGVLGFEALATDCADCAPGWSLADSEIRLSSVGKFGLDVALNVRGPDRVLALSGRIYGRGNDLVGAIAEPGPAGMSAVLTLTLHAD